MTGPIKPKDVQKRRDESIPDEVFIVFNDLITENWDGHSATVRQAKAADGVARALNITRTQVYDRGLLDVESAYRKAGWKVEYDKPGYNESYEAFFVFRKK